MLLSMLILALSSPAAAPLPRLEGPHAPPGYEAFCFPIQFDFEPNTASITNPPPERVAAILDYGFRDAEWFYLGLSVPRSEKDSRLVRQRADAVIRLLSDHGIRSDRIQLGVFEADYAGAGFSVMIPPEDVARVRAAEARGIMFC